jgi:hypothetical protein
MLLTSSASSSVNPSSVFAFSDIFISILYKAAADLSGSLSHKKPSSSTNCLYVSLDTRKLTTRSTGLASSWHSGQSIIAPHLLHTPHPGLLSSLTSYLHVHGGCAAVNRGADYVKPLALAPCARTRSLTGHRTPINQTASA